MSLSDLASLATFVSGVAVLVSLGFLYFQLRQIGAQIAQSEKNQRASIRAARVSRTVDFIASFAEPSAAEAVRKGNAAEEMSSVEVAQYMLFCLGRFINAEDAFTQNSENLLDEAALVDLRMSMMAAFATPGFRAAWKLQRPQFHGQFVDFVDGILADSQAMGGPAADATARWRAGIAAEKALARPAAPVATAP